MSRRILLIQGQVQGVGFRPFVYEIACRLGLTGFVRNQGGAVRIEVEGPDAALDRLLVELRDRPPPGARIDSIRHDDQPSRGERAFTIDSSDVAADNMPFIPADIAVCEACLAELFDPADRRHRYPFLNCAYCGPRLTIIREAPYDRRRTSMASFPLCPDCRREYEDPRDRRFHAQPIACPTCGPRLALHNAQGASLSCADPLQSAAEALCGGQIVAVKSLGGYHLACDAGNTEAVKLLRIRKLRPDMPLAVMVADLDAAQRLCRITPEEAALLESPARPIVLLRRRPERETKSCVVAGVAQGSPDLGIMLPYTPLHHLLLRAVDGKALVMTSGNDVEYPIAFDDADAFKRLAKLADLFLTHNRSIVVRCDDSVVRVVAGDMLPIRRSRGYVPTPLELPVACTRPLIALGGNQKSTFALAHGRHAFLSHHLGEVDQLQSYQEYSAAIKHYERLFAVEPELLVHDLHPNYGSTMYARSRAEAVPNKRLPRLAVQHHHAHLAACLTDNGRNEQVIGVVFDGTGYGTDGAIWGGEFLVGDCAQFRRVAHFRYVPLPGGDKAVSEPWRMTLSYLVDAGIDFVPDWIEDEIPPQSRVYIRNILNKKTHSPPTSSVGRLFDAVAGLIRLQTYASYEGQAATAVEWAAEGNAQDLPYRYELSAPQDSAAADPLQIDVRPLIADVVTEVRENRPASRVARRFHATLVDIVERVCGRVRERTGLQTVALSGGCFLNELLLRETTSRLMSAGFQVLRHRRVPPGDGGLSLGQAAIAAAWQSCENAAQRM